MPPQTVLDLRKMTSVIECGVKVKAGEAAMPYPKSNYVRYCGWAGCFFEIFRWMSGQNSFTTIVMVS